MLSDADIEAASAAGMKLYDKVQALIDNAGGTLDDIQIVGVLSCCVATRIAQSGLSPRQRQFLLDKTLEFQATTCRKMTKVAMSKIIGTQTRRNPMR